MPIHMVNIRDTKTSLLEPTCAELILKTLAFVPIKYSNLSDENERISN